MLRLLSAAALLLAVSAASVVAPRPANASVVGDAPWCAVVSTGWGEIEWNCSFWRFEDCVPEVISGNRGFCQQNPNFQEPPPRAERYRRRHHRYR